eukprot:gnl/TRDRNA2_/TRDRNA2_132630_c0_seq4.p1 gnl/TRDRNA2_/TRDRNA2_132630_c0~~gnl/TRDRNA2_/TRDRNA2_132630_c0_seq4.p1  ORF type:complete len:551 (-),score=119.80 gnl/TRDRNA2_/TRDRNA2_132630_c0_seq4:122-1774(-)
MYFMSPWRPPYLSAVVFATIVSTLGALVIESRSKEATCGSGDEDAFEDALDRFSWQMSSSDSSDEATHKPHRGSLAQRSSSRTYRVEMGAELAASAHLASWHAAAQRVYLQRVNASDGEQKKVLPPVCASEVPLDDPYWKQKDSYTIKKNGHDITYNECRYSDGCKRQYTNLERLRSIRQTLAVTHRFLEAQNVQHVLFGGSAVGAYRCNDVLPWDVDSDVLVLDGSFPQLLELLKGSPDKIGWAGHGHAIDLEPHGFPGFVLMEKFAGCLPLAIVDKSTGFFTDLFPMKPMSTGVLSPWWSGKVPCDTKTLFSPCTSMKCNSWSMENMLPPTECKIDDATVSCPLHLGNWLVDHFGHDVTKPDISTRNLEKVKAEHRQRLKTNTEKAVRAAGSEVAADPIRTMEIEEVKDRLHELELQEQEQQQKDKLAQQKAAEVREMEKKELRKRLKELREAKRKEAEEQKRKLKEQQELKEKQEQERRFERRLLESYARKLKKRQEEQRLKKENAKQHKKRKQGKKNKRLRETQQMESQMERDRPAIRFSSRLIRR